MRICSCNNSTDSGDAERGKECNNSDDSYTICLCKTSTIVRYCVRYLC